MGSAPRRLSHLHPETVVPASLRFFLALGVCLLLLPEPGAGRQASIPLPPGDSLALAAALVSLEEIRERGGWDPVPAGALLRAGESDPRGRIGHVVLSPYWNVPPNILRQDKLPEIRRDPSVLERQGSERIRRVAAGNVEQWVPLPEPVPIRTVYWTAWVDADGTLHLADDLYGLDTQRPLAALEENMSECAPV